MPLFSSLRNNPICFKNISVQLKVQDRFAKRNKTASLKENRIKTKDKRQG